MLLNLDDTDVGGPAAPMGPHESRPAESKRRELISPASGKLRSKTYVVLARRFFGGRRANAASWMWSEAIGTDYIDEAEAPAHC